MAVLESIGKPSRRVVEVRSSQNSRVVIIKNMNSEAATETTFTRKRTVRRAVFFYLRLALAFILLIFLLRMGNLRDIGHALGSLKLHFVVAALILMLINYCLKTYRWASILWIQRPDISLGQLLRFNFISIFLGNLLPSSFAPDVVRIFYMSRRTVEPKAAISSIVADRILGNFSLALLTMGSVLILKDLGLLPLGSLISYGAGAFLLFALAIPLTLRNATWMDGINKRLYRWTGQAWFKSAHEIYQQLQLYARHQGAMTKSLSLAFVNLFIAVMEFYLIAQALSATVSIGYFFLFIPLVIFLATLPVSIAGLGLVEASLVYFFTQVGMAVETCIASAVVFRVLQLLCLLPGAAIYVTDGFFVKKLPA